MQTPLRSLLLLALACVSTAATVRADAVRLFYAINQKVFEVTAFEDGLPKLDAEVIRESAPRPEEMDNFCWQVGGGLPFDVAYAAPIVDYEVYRVAPSYAERFKSAKIEARLKYDAIVAKAGWNDLRPTDFVVVGWTVDGRVYEAFVARKDANGRFTGAAKIDVRADRKDGFPLCWVVRDGKPLVRDTVNPWDAFVLANDDTETPKDLAKARDADGNTALHYAAANGADRFASSIIRRSKSLVAKANTAKAVPMRMAVSCGRADSASILAEAKSPLSDTARTYFTSFIYSACEYGQIDVLKVLAVNKSKSNDQYNFALVEALNRNYWEAALHLLSLGATFKVSEGVRKEALVLSKFSNGYPDVGFKLMEILKVEPTVEDKGFNLFHAVGSYADTELLDRLLALGCDIAKRNDAGYLPMDIAVGLGNVEAICWFIDNGGRAPEKSGFLNPISHAINAGREDSVQCLINYGYDVNREISEGVTPLMFATIKGQTSIAESILGSGGVWNLDSQYLSLCVDRILRQDAVDLFRSLLAQGLNVERSDRDGLGLVELADFYGAEKILGQLSESGLVASTGILSAGELDERLVVLAPLRVDYPIELQRKHGDLEIDFKVAFDQSGSPAAVRYGVELDPEIETLLEVAIFKVRIAAPLANGRPTPVALTMRTTLETDMSAASVFELSSVDEKPSAIRQPRPIYPYVLQQRRIVGEVLLEFIISPDGAVVKVRVVRSTHEAFEQPSINAIMESVWKPAKKDGVPVACVVRQAMRFSP